MEIKLKKKETIKSINKALKLLEFLSKNGNEMGIAEISEKMNMGLSTVHRILNTLKYRGYILQNQKTLKYRLGMKLFELGCEVQSTKNLIKNTRSYLKKLTELTKETSNLAILEGKEVIYLNTIESSEILRTGIHQGTRLPAHCTALGKVLLAFLPQEDFNSLYENNKLLVSITPNSISSFDGLKKELKKVKEQGYAIDREEFKVGINCISSPIFGKDGKFIAAISITGPATRLTLDKMENDKHILINISKQISENILM
jgi:DNA-binding IclR family transcriptional regulator